MNEEDLKLRELFADFRPAEQKSEIEFMAQLQQQMQAVDTVKDYCRAEQRRNRRAVIIAALAGVLTGVILTLAMPYFSDGLGSVLSQLVPWGTVALGVVSATFLAYYLTKTISAFLYSTSARKERAEVRIK